MDQAIEAKKACAKELLDKMNVVGVGAGYKFVDGKPTNQQAVMVFVQRKLPEINKYSVNSIPDNIGGIPTDIIEVGNIIKQPFDFVMPQAAGFHSKIRPLRPGYGCGHKDITAGTIGGIFIDKDGDKVILSNCHVLANEGKAQIGDNVCQPAPMDGGNLDCAATLKSFVKLHNSGNVQDSAIARINSDIEIDSSYPVVNRALRSIGQPVLNQQLQKFGRTTGHTTGHIIGLHSTFTVGYDFGSASFDNCIVTTAMSDGGDSGSILCDNNMNAIGLLFAGSPKVTLANVLSNVIDHYDLKIYNQDNTPDSPPPIVSPNFEGWNIINSCGAIIANNNGIINITAKSNGACFLERNTGFNTISCNIRLGSDKGATWGPGLVIASPHGMIKVNLRHGGSYGGYYNSNEYLGIGKVESPKTYRLRIRKTNNSLIGEVFDSSWRTIVKAPLFNLSQAVVRIGKTDAFGHLNNHSDLGIDGTCIISNISVS